MSSKGSNQYLQRGLSGLISYEDIIVSQYMNGLNTKASWNDESKISRSSFIKMLERKETKSSSRSATNIGSKTANIPQGAKKILAWKSTLPESVSSEERLRPTSAPVHSHSSQRSSLMSVSSSDFNGSSNLTSSGVSSSRRVRRHKPVYKRKSKVLCVRAFVNGDRDNYARVTASDLKQLLEECTAKLNLVSAARKLFLSDGTLIKDFKQIKMNSDIYVSCGEAFKDPFGKYKEKEKLGRLSTWTMNGILFPESKTRGKTKPSLSERMKDLVEKQKRRVLVFANGAHTKGKEVVAGRFDEFLDDCTQKLSFESGARALYDWDGKEIGSFSEVPVVDNILQPTTNIVIGPLWVTRGAEKFTYKGPCGFVDTLLQTTKDRLKEARDYENQLELRYQGSAEGMSVEVMSFTTKEIEKELQQVRNKISGLESVIPKLKSRNKRLQQKKREEESYGVNDITFKYQNIVEIEENSRLLGRKGIRLKVYENGKTDDEVIVYFNIHEALKGVSNNEALRTRLLDAITAHRKVLKQGYGPRGRPLAQRIYRDNGQEVTNVRELKTDDSIWLSFGEEFKQPYTYTLQLVVDKTKPSSLWNEKKIILREPLNDDISGKELATLWKIVDSYPTDRDFQAIMLDMEPQQRVAYARGLQPSQIDEKNTFIQCKKNKDLILYPELSVEKKLAKGDLSVWPPDSQKWAIHEDGLIYSRAFPQLCLCLTDLKLQVNYPEGMVLEGYVVKLGKRNASNANQLWAFTPTGDICSLANPSLVLTWTANENCVLVDQEDPEESCALSSEELAENPEEARGESSKSEFSGLTTMKDVYGGEKYGVAVLPKLPGKHQAIGSQRWALKQESLNNLGQWKNSRVPNPEWNRKALSWPVNQDRTRNKDFKWPMEGFLICNAPPMKRREVTSVGPPVRLRVLKNGENDVSRAVTVIGPDLSNMARDICGKSSPLSTKSKKLSSMSSDRNDIRNLELNLFLDRCTEALQLPFAARRLFDESGTELFTLSDLERNQVVFASCGETWINFKTSHSEQQRKFIITNLAADVAKLRHFCSLRNPKDLVLSVEGSIGAGSPVCVAYCSYASEEREHLQESEINHQENGDLEIENSLERVRNTLLTSHERAHVKAEERLKNLRWPWETAITTNGEFSLEDKQTEDFNHEVVYSDNHLHKRYRHYSVKNHSSKEILLLAHRWSYKDGFISTRGNNKLVLGTGHDPAEDKLVNDVILCKKRLDVVNQRWTIADDGTIHLRSNSNLVLTVAGPRVDSVTPPEDSNVGYEGCAVLIMPRKYVNGNANQLWSYDSSSGLLSAFATDSLNKEITAANKSDICSYTVTGSNEVPQVGYVLQDDITKTFLCEACGKALRGKSRLQKLEQSHSFSCVLGQADKKDKSGCFKYLSNKVDLTTSEAEATLGMWEEQLKRLKKVTSIRSLHKEIQAAQSVPAVRIRAYKNGGGSRSEPVLVIGSSIDSLLVQCTARLGLVTFARRLYTVDGEQISDVNQLRNGAGDETGYDIGTHHNKDEKPVKDNRETKSLQPNEDPIDTVYTANQYNITNDKEAERRNVTERIPRSNHCVSTDKVTRRSNRPAIDVFVSCGEPFVPLQEVDKQYLLQRKHQNERTWVETHLETEKHVLRQMQGRRIAARLSSEVSLRNTLTSSWQDLTRSEENKLENIEELKEHLKDLKFKQQHEKEVVAPNSSPKISTSKRLYNQTKTVRISVYENGDSDKRSVSVCGSSLLEILSISTTRLGLSNAARRIFTTTGQQVHDMAQLVKGDSYCVSCGENFIHARDRQKIIGRKATWSRINRLTGGALAHKTNERIVNNVLALTGPPS